MPLDASLNPIIKNSKSLVSPHFSQKPISRALALALMLTGSFAFAQKDLYSVESFKPAKAQKADSRTWIVPLVGSTLSEAQTSNLVADQLYLRRKISNDSYVILTGKPSEDAFKELHSFEVSGSMSDWMKLKFYRKNNETAFKDEKDIYFTQNRIYISGLSELYYLSEGTWKKLSAASKTLGGILVETQPSGASVYVDGNYIGKTPWKSSLIEEGFYSYKLSKEGFADVVIGTPVNKESATASKTDLISIDLAKSNSIGSERFLQIEKDPLDTLDRKLERINKELNGHYAQMDTMSRQFEARYYPIIPPPEGVDPLSNAGYIHYQSSYVLTKKEALFKVLSLYKKRVEELEQARQNIKLKIAEIEKGEKTELVKALGFKAKLEAPEVLSLKIKFLEMNEQMDVIWEGKLQGSAELIKKMAEQIDLGKGNDLFKLRVTYEAKPVRIFKEDKQFNRLYRFKNIDIQVDDETVVAAGLFLLPDYLAVHPEVVAWKNSQVNNVQMDQKVLSEMNQKIQDEAKAQAEKAYQDTLALLRGEVSEIPESKFTFKGSEVVMSAYALNKTEVSQALYQRITYQNPSIYKSPLKPVHNVTWSEADKFCKDIGGFLPTEAQWENASRSGTKTYFYWGAKTESPTEYAWYTENSLDKGVKSPQYGPQNVASKKPNDWGLYDMAGNVSEWVKDFDSFSDFFIEKRDPQGPTNEIFNHYKVYKGGHWKSEKRELDPTKKDTEDPRYHSDDMGFRCAFKPNWHPPVSEILSRISKNKPKESEKNVTPKLTPSDVPKVAPQNISQVPAPEKNTAEVKTSQVKSGDNKVNDVKEPEKNPAPSAPEVNEKK